MFIRTETSFLHSVSVYRVCLFCCYLYKMKGFQASYRKIKLYLTLPMQQQWLPSGWSSSPSVPRQLIGCRICSAGPFLNDACLHFLSLPLKRRCESRARLISQQKCERGHALQTPWEACLPSERSRRLLSLISPLISCLHSSPSCQRGLLRF